VGCGGCEGGKGKGGGGVDREGGRGVGGEESITRVD